MTALHWIARHYILAWILASAAFTIGWTVYLAWFAESDEARDARRRRARVERAKQNLRRNIEFHATREKARLARLNDARVNQVVADVIAESRPKRDYTEMDVAS